MHVNRPAGELGFRINFALCLMNTPVVPLQQGELGGVDYRPIALCQLKFGCAFVHSLDCFHRECLVLALKELASLGRNVPRIRTRPIPWTEWVRVQSLPVSRPSIFLAPGLGISAEYRPVRSWPMEIQRVTMRRDEAYRTETHSIPLSATRSPSHLSPLTVAGFQTSITQSPLRVT